MKKTISSITVIMMLLMGIFTIFPAKAQQTTIFVDPSTVEATALGETFTVDIVLSDVSDLYGWEVKVFWERQYLNCTAEEYPFLPEGLNWEAPNNLQLGPGIEPNYNATHGRWYHGLSALPMSPPMPTPFTGTITLATLTFEVIAAPTAAPGIESTISLAESKLSDSAAQPIAHTLVAADYLFPFEAAPGPWLEVVPDFWQARAEGEENNIDVKINDVRLEHRIVGAEFKLRFDGDLLEVVSATEGPFMMDPAWATNGTQFVGPIVEEDEEGWFCLIGVLLIPNDGATSKWDTFPEGSGVLATITFRVREGAGAADDVVGCDLILDDIKLANDKADSVRPRPSVDGRFELRLVVFAGEVDIFTQWEYESPMEGTEWLGPGYGGSGWHMPSEGFAPQGEVQLFANVSYRGAGVANKPVAFTVEDPNGVVLSQRTTQSNAEGIAEAPFRIPTDAINGTWKATANVDIAGTVVEDYVEFEVDWIIKILSVEADKDTYAKGEALMFTITYKNLLTFHEVPVTFTIVVFDDYEYTKVPVARMTVTTTVQPGPGTETLNGMTIIPSWAFVGTARAYANAFNPENGAPYCTEQYAEFSIVRA